jgi:hypothetical protein
MRTAKALTVVVALASLAACSNSDSDPDTSPRTEATAAPSATTATPTPTPTPVVPKPEKTYVRAPGDPRKHVVTIIIRDKGRSYVPHTCVALAGEDFADVLAFSGPSRHYENAPLKHSEFAIPRQGRSLPDGRCEATMTVTLPYRPRYTVGIAQDGQGIPGPEDPHGDTTIVTRRGAQDVVLINYPT